MTVGAKTASIFPTFFLSGFECSTFLWKDRGRRDLVAETQHRENARDDYALLRDLGIAVSREGVPWPLVETRSGYDFASVDVLLDAMNRAQVLPIWDLCHYGYPDDADPFAPDFEDRFARYCRAAAEYLIPRVAGRGPNFFTPINEITYFAFAGGEWGWIAPFGKRREERNELRLALCRAAIAGVRAIREVDPDARMINMDPLVNIVAPRDRPDLADA
ncbi:MAG: b-glycosidase, partial [Chloroflexota bacterium]|nr:b-glycosidase [Chloroflexota bacterium]